MNQPSALNPHYSPEQLWREKTRSRANDVAGIIHRHLANLSFADIKGLAAVNPAEILPFVSPVLPADKNVLAKIFPGYQEVTGLAEGSELRKLKDYSSAKENYGTAPGEAAALIVGIVRALQPETAFVFGTARGRIEQLIAQNCKAEIATIDMPSEITETAPGRPDSNNIRYRNNIGIDSDDKIGDIFKKDPSISGRIHQILGDSFTFEADRLSNSMRLVVIDGNHKLENSLTDLTTAFDMIHKAGGVIILDDFRKTSPLNAGVDAAAALFGKITGLPVLQTMPKQGEDGLNAAAALIVVPENFSKSRALLDLRSLCHQLSLY